MEHREYFNKLADKWDEICFHDPAKLKAIVKMAGISEGQKVLDVGTGTGVMLPFIHELVGEKGEIAAIDIAEKMLEVAKQKYHFDNIRFILGDIATTLLPENYYDLIMCYSVFPHFKDKPGIVALMARLLKPKGRLVIAHSQSREAINSLHAKLDVVRKDQLPEAATIEEYMKQAQLVPVLTEDNHEMFVVIGQKE
ncbi:MAG TPA: methyltransferase domain-containing protein [Thermoanaerobacterales bacterium]|uniref:class I SAM-dependent methyltransferase n=1 Tax=Tepidanaerobacter sp. GT38 TaxID=2722793 RepID=UPI0017DB6D01|nr:methyltransferase domain-containing protein [Tepidanaerobacter sp. GT38]MCG1012352.1 methyltransferase domain-containing protein [Tepidanaerobacter sp. GT38]HHY42455.1 methyltransferase domain-containing protein [Thermoanaerobacterales bacterium]